MSQRAFRPQFVEQLLTFFDLLDVDRSAVEQLTKTALNFGFSKQRNLQTGAEHDMKALCCTIGCRAD